MENQTKRDLIILIDSGDTLVNESTEIRDENGDVIRADLIEGAKEMLSGLCASGYRIALVADGTTKSFENVYHQHDLYHMFEVKVISQEEDVQKPHPHMFKAAMERMGLTKADKHRIVMIGNNLQRDTLGANMMGITSILISWSPRYVMQPDMPGEVPDYVVAMPGELTALLDVLDRQVKNKRILMQA